jgi:chaperone BCS1
MLDALWDFLARQLENGVVMGGLALNVAGAGAALAARLPGLVRHLVATTLITSVSVDDRSELFDELLEWLANHPYGLRCRRLRADLDRPQDGDDTIRLTPSSGPHLFRHRGVLVWVDRFHARQGDGVLGRGHPTETLRIRALTAKVAFLRTLLAEVHETHGDPDRNRVAIYAIDSTQEWSRLVIVRKRSLSTLVLAPGLAEAAIADARAFLASGQWYADRGIPWRRGYLLHGPPGTGKSSLVKVMAGELGRDICLLSLTADRLDDVKLASLLSEAPRRAILLFEDIDALFARRRQGEVAAGVTFSGLLNAIDGVLAQEGRILCMTTNHPERLDPALIRPGRIDRRFAFDLAGESERARLFLAFYPGETARAARFAASARPASAAALQGHFLLHRDDPAGALAAVDTLGGCATPPPVEATELRA